MTDERRATSRSESAATAATDRLQRRMGASLMRAEVVLDGLFADEVYVKSITFRMPVSEGEEYLAVVRVSTLDGAQVGFHGAPTLAECVEGVLNRLQNRSMKYRADQFG